MFQDTSEGDAFLEQTENSTLRDDDTAQTLSFEITHDNTSLSPSQSAANEDLLSSSAPMYIPVKNGASQSAAGSPTQEEYEKKTPFGSFAMSQSLKRNDQLDVHGPVQRATSTGPRMEQTENNPTPTTHFSSFDDPLFPFLSPDLGADMKNSNEQFNSNPTTVNDNATDSQAGMSTLQKRKWQILKGMSEVNISPHFNTTETANNSMTVLNSSEVQPYKKLKGNSKYASSVKFSKPLKRKSSISSNLSFVGNYVFGSGVFHSPARSQTSMASDRVNYIADPAGMFPSLMSLNSFEVAIDNDGNIHPSSQPRSVSAYNSRQNSGNDLQSLEKKRAFTRSGSATSRGSSSSLSTRIFRDNDEKTVHDEEADKLTEVKNVISRTQPSKKLWQQTMPDLEEGPESDTLTVQSTIRNNLAAAALAIGVREKRDSERKETEEEKEKEKEILEKPLTTFIYTKNLFILCFSYFAAFASYMSLRNLQSSLNDKGGLGMISLSCVYASICIGSIFTTTIVQRLRPKLSIIISFSGLLIYNLTNYYPTYATLIPGSILAGFSMAITWTAQGTYLANNALASSEISGKKFSEVLSFYQGMFFSSYQLSQVVGGLISSFLFSLQSKGSQAQDLTNATLTNSSASLLHTSFNFTSNYTPSLTVTPDYLSFNTTPDFSSFNLSSPNFTHSDAPHVNHSCGMLYCPGQKTSRLDVKIDPWLYFMMVTVFLCSTILSLCVIVCGLNPLEGVLKKNFSSVSKQMFHVFHMLSNPNMLCLIPLMSYSLLQTTFMFGEFNKAHVTCILGIHMIGYMTVFLSLFSSVFAFLSGNMQKYTGTEAIIVTGVLCHLMVLTTFWFWTPNKNGVVWFFVVVSVWGAGDGMIMAQIVSLLSTLFMDRKEAAFSAYKMVQSGSAFLMFITGAYICTSFKVIVLTVMALLGLTGMATLKVKSAILKSIGASNKNVVAITDVSKLNSNNNARS